MNKNSAIIVFFLMVLIVFTGKAAESDEGCQSPEPGAFGNERAQRISDKLRGMHLTAQASQDLVSQIRAKVQLLKQRARQSPGERETQLTAFLLSKVGHGDVLHIDMAYIKRLLDDGVDHITSEQLQEAVGRANQSIPVAFPGPALDDEGLERVDGEGGVQGVDQDVLAARARSLKRDG